MLSVICLPLPKLPLSDSNLFFLSHHFSEHLLFFAEDCLKHEFQSHFLKGYLAFGYLVYILYNCTQCISDFYYSFASYKSLPILSRGRWLYCSELAKIISVYSSPSFPSYCQLPFPYIILGTVIKTQTIILIIILCTKLLILLRFLHYLFYFFFSTKNFNLTRCKWKQKIFQKGEPWIMTICIIQIPLRRASIQTPLLY